jgi:Pyruvate/2-oxoacid:ferredoxin oxidoreductase gamma subunit
MIIALRDQNKVKAISLSAMALNIETDDGHPNKMPFSGILTRLDEPSDAAPDGAHGRRIIVTAEAARKALPTLLGMAVGYTPSFDGHDSKAKIGVITSADIVGNAIAISGFVYASDFPEIASSIRAMKSLLGFSFEAQRLVVADPTADILTITDLAFTGAAIIRKDKAAFTTTSIAASAATTKLRLKSSVRKMEIDMTQDELNAMVAEALAARTTTQTKQAEEMKKAIAVAVEAATKPLRDKIAAAETRANDAMAKARLAAGAPQRRTMPGMEGRLSIGPEGDEHEQRLALKNGAELA